MNRLKIEVTDGTASTIYWDGQKVGTLHYTPSAIFSYRIEWLDGAVNYGCSIDYIERIIRAVATRDDLVLPAPTQHQKTYKT